MDDFWYDMSQLWVGTFFYGIYLVLFSVCILILLRRPRNSGNTVLLITAIALFTLSTVQAVINLILGAAEIDDIDIPFHDLNKAAAIIYGINNIIADGLVIYRCYVVWDRNIYVVILPLLMLIVTSVFGVDIRLPENPFFALSLATNVLVTGLTAGRIWWICHQCRVHFKLKTDTQRRCLSTVSILVESGVLYSGTVLAYLILGAIPSASIVQEPIFEMLTQVMGIAPTLIIVRVGLGVSVPNTESMFKFQTLEAKSGDSSTSKPPVFGISFSQQSNLDKDVDVEKGQPEYGSRRAWSF